MLRQRVVSAAVMVPLTALVVYLGGWWFFVPLLMVIALATFEFYQLMRSGGYHPAIPVGLLFSVALMISARFSSAYLTGAVITAALLVSLVWHLVDYERGRGTAATDWALTVAGALYIGWVGGLFVRLRDLPGGVGWVVLAFLPVWIGDSAAYFVGIRWGKHKCCPRLSPKKSWEGTLAGWITGTLTAFAIGVALGLPGGMALFLGGLIAFLTPLGDLAESMFKRQVGAKDSSHLIPGHGGALDRLDSLLFSVAIVYYFILFTR